MECDVFSRVDRRVTTRFCHNFLPKAQNIKLLLLTGLKNIMKACYWNALVPLTRLNNFLKNSKDGMGVKMGTR